MKLLKWLKRKLGLEKRSKALKLFPTPKVTVYRPPKKPRQRIYRRLRKAVHQDIGKFMKHGRQSKHYRKAVKAKIKPEWD